jgi:hypothetical protein
MPSRDQSARHLRSCLEFGLDMDGL